MFALACQNNRPHKSFLGQLAGSIAGLKDVGLEKRVL